jgi:hypothetical protein
MPDSLQEEHCREQFDSWLRQKWPSSTIKWEPGDNPPDFWLRLGEQRFAVEVTRVQYPDTTRSWLWKQVDEFEKELQQSLCGTYFVTFNGSPEDFAFAEPRKRRKLSDKLWKFIQEYVARTRCADQEQPKRLPVSRNASCEVSKESRQGQMLCQVGPDPEGGSEDEVRSELLPLVQRAIRNKTRVAERALAEWHAALVLILHDMYHPACPRLFKDCIQKTQEAEQFHAIYVARDNNHGFLAYGRILQVDESAGR